MYVFTMTVSPAPFLAANFAQDFCILYLTFHQQPEEFRCLIIISMRTKEKMEQPRLLEQPRKWIKKKFKKRKYSIVLAYLNVVHFVFVASTNFVKEEIYRNVLFLVTRGCNLLR